MTAFTPHQDIALKAVADWLRAKPGQSGTPQVFRLFGYAGTGKTTLARHIADGVTGEVKYAAFTGKAAMVMRKYGARGASTIHSLIYALVSEKDGEPKLPRRAEFSIRRQGALLLRDRSHLCWRRLAFLGSRQDRYRPG